MTNQTKSWFSSIAMNSNSIFYKSFKEIQHWVYILVKTWLPGLVRQLRYNFPDRIVMEDIILPYFASRSEFKKILFVGCDWYTKHYQTYFKGKEYWTIEIDKEQSKYGAKNHINDGIQNLGKYVENNYFDLIIFNGVFGWGVNTKEDTETSFQQCFQYLREEGILVFGWNDIPDAKPFPVLEECGNLQKFDSYFFPPLSTAQYLTPETAMRHTFNFYIKPVATAK
ncbi:MAG: class I SAM-dependent methyltransferase [Aulosira sp. DedVER01a]|nr:class I SAM-dependent methyltransferase [Aulosira sp. ZfuVER01]MDZ8002496.1 class I SAM-dependent methyltransferase [Aulosira sp. DedVER01a]